MSLRTRLILTFILLILIILTITAVSLGVILRNYQRDISLARLGNAVIPLAVQARGLFANGATPKEVMTRLQPQVGDIGSVIVLTDKGLVLADDTFNLTNRNLGIA